jgi:hypothetical protein
MNVKVVTAHTIYDKSEIETLTESEIRALIKTHHTREEDTDIDADS